LAQTLGKSGNPSFPLEWWRGQHATVSVAEFVGLKVDVLAAGD
jgi:hypothetical protein